MSIYMVEFALFLGAASAALALRHRRMDRSRPAPVLLSAAVGAIAIAIGGPGSGLVDAAARQLIHPDVPYVPHVTAALLMMWAATRLVPTAVAAHNEALEWRAERYRRTAMHIAAAIVIPLWIASMNGGVLAEIAWTVIGLGTWLFAFGAVSVTALLIAINAEDLLEDGDWVTALAVAGLVLFGMMSFLCVIHPDAIRPQVVAGLGIALMMAAAAGARLRWDHEKLPSGRDPEGPEDAA